MKVAVMKALLAAAPPSNLACAFIWSTSTLPKRPLYSLRRPRPGAPLSATAAGDLPLPPKLYNTATREKQPLQPQSGRRVKFYSCGPTVYDSAHIGNFRAFLTYDVLKRWLLYRGYSVEHVCNLTDVDDKIIQRMQRDGVGLKDLTDKYARLFFDDLAALNIIPASAYPRATEHISEIVEMVIGLMEKGLAYERGGSVYFRVAAFPRYGALANLKVEGLQDGAAEGGGVNDVTDFEAEKESSRDFALWKAYKPSDGDVFWDTPLGRGRPGWHVECSAMARKFLGDTLDLHAGGVDLVFPHHENEVAQSEGATGQPFCNCWIHNAFVNVGGEKMSKSLGNFLTLRGCLKTAADVRAFRYLVVSSQYRSPLNFTPEALSGAGAALRRLDRLRQALLAAAAAAGGAPADRSTRAVGENRAAAAAVSTLSERGREDKAEAARAGASAAAAAVVAAAAAAALAAFSEAEEPARSEELRKAAAAGLAQFESGMDDDLNTARAAAGLFTVVKAGEKALKAAGGLSAADARMLLRVLGGMDAVFGLFYEPVGFAPDPAAAAAAGGDANGAVLNGAAANVPEEVSQLLQKRAAAKAAKDWAAADAAREAITALGYSIKDVKGGEVQVTKV